MAELMAVFVGLVGVVAPFVVVALAIYFNYKKQKNITERVPAEALGEWYKTETETRKQRRRGSSFVWGGLLIGGGLGYAIASVIGICVPDLELELSLTILFAGAGLIGAYFIEREIDKKSNENS